jgi:uncharacterized protein
MDSPLDALAVRVLGSLVEKEITTPDNYPLTLHAVTAACNQTSNRDPVIDVDAAAVAASLEDLARRSLVRAVHRSDSRARRYRHLLPESLHLHAPEAAVMCVLMLRGAQTAGEIRARAARLHEFTDIAHVDITLQSLMTLAAPLVTQLPRRPGQKEVRYAHLLSGEPLLEDGAVEQVGVEQGTPGKGAPEKEAPGKGAPYKGAVERGAPGEVAETSRIEALEQDVAALRTELAELRALFDGFREQFE